MTRGLEGSSPLSTGEGRPDSELVVALVGNPNTGKSTIFNALTGLRQHTGNWPGKTVTKAVGTVILENLRYKLVDLPGSYSLFAHTEDEVVARDFVISGEASVTVVVVDATALERNLSLVLQVCALTDQVVVCCNLIDEARRRGIVIDIERLSSTLGVPVVATSARTREGVDELLAAVGEVALRVEPVSPSRNQLTGEISAALRIGLDVAKDLREEVATGVHARASEIARVCVMEDEESDSDRDLRIDRIVTSRRFGLPLMLLLLGIVFYITIAGANVPSAMLATGLMWLEGKLALLLLWLGSPEWVVGLLVHGVYRGLAWVISVMLPPMAIFFPLFTLLEDLGYLPRVAFNLDNLFRRFGAHGKQSLTMAMGFGCNAAGVISTRIIESPRERLIAIVTNNFVPCNGRWPTMIMVASVFIAASVPAGVGSLVAVASVVTATLLGVVTTLIASRFLASTWLKGAPSGFQLEMPPYRIPRVFQVIYRSLIDRTLFVLGRAVAVAAPAGAVIWVLANVDVGGMSLFAQLSAWLDPVGRFFGLDGVILLAVIVAIPANEIVIPTIIMGYMATGQLTEVTELAQLRAVFENAGWDVTTAICLMFFMVLRNPCSTTTWTIWKETRSLRWTVLSNVLPLAVALAFCAVIAHLIKAI